MTIDHLLPMELIIEILLWLPVVSLMRFKCVCKSWRSLFESSNFISLHLKKTNNKYNNVNVLLVTYNDPKKFFLLSSYETLDFTANLEFPNCERYGNNRIDIVRSCNGVICATYFPDNDLALWNPATREVKFVQVPYEDSEQADYCYFGFGLDPKTNDYKVVRIRDTSNLFFSEVYSLRTASWRRIDTVFPADYIMDCDLSPFVNGKVSWLVSNEGNAPVLLSFDMSDEFFLTTPCPDGFGTLPPRHKLSLMVLNELVAIMVTVGNLDDSAFDLWVLNEYGLKKSWVQLYTIGPLSTIFYPLGFWKNGEWLLENEKEGHLVLFNPISLEMKNIDIDDGMLVTSIKDVVVYKESLVRLKKEHVRVLIPEVILNDLIAWHISNPFETT